MKKLYIIVGLFVTLLGCTEPLVVTDYTYPQVLTGETQKSWKVRNIQIVRQGKGTLTLDPSVFLDNEGETCNADNIYTFINNSERGYRITEGATRCNADDPDINYEGNFTFVNSSATLSFFMPALTDQGILQFTVAEITENTLVLDLYFDETSNYRLNFRPTGTD